jgi:hypothetical protein
MQLLDDEAVDCKTKASSVEGGGPVPSTAVQSSSG